MKDMLYALKTPDGLWLTRKHDGGYWNYGSSRNEDMRLSELVLLTKEEMEEFTKLPNKIFCPTKTANLHYRKRDMTPVLISVEIKLK